VFLGPDTGQHQQFGRVERACRNDHFLSRQHMSPPVAFLEFDALRHFGNGVDQHSGDERALDYVQVGEVSPQVRFG